MNCLRRPSRSIPKSAILLLTILLATLAQSPANAGDGFDEKLYDALEYRSIGPYRGGRSCAVTGIPGDPLTFYFGGTGGGVFKSIDGGQSWNAISDGFFGGSMGAVSVSEWDPNVLYAGGGEKTVRGNVSHGDGVWKSMDAGKSWEHVGLADSRHVVRLRIHPRDPDLVYAAVLGHLFGPNEERGVYRSNDGGVSWERILFVNENAGAIDLAMDPTNPRVLFASFWRVQRTPYSLESGGEGSTIWKSTDGGDSWTDITNNEGLPAGTRGIAGVSVSPVNPQRIWAMIESEQGGLFRSDDGGESWTRTNKQRDLRQRAWYYTRVYADTQDEDKVYVLNVGFWRSKDGGRSFDRIRTPHGDHHDLWIDPGNSDRMIIGDDGGAQVSFDGGENWTTYHNQPTSQFYRVTTDDHFPYRIYGAQQDNSTVRILHRSDSGAISEFDWEPTAGGESGWIAPDPENNDIVYGGSYGGFLTRVDHGSGEVRAVNVWPDNPMGHGAEGMNPRFQWNFPILFSRHDHDVLYAAGNILYKSTDEGQSWEAISGDLTRADPATLGPSGGPITKDNTGVEYYATIFAVAEDIHEAGVIWCGSDDGRIHVTRDHGATWQDVTPKTKLLPEWAQINGIEADPFDAGSVYVAATRYKSDDFHPYLLTSSDYGKSWKRIDEGIDELHFTRAIRADPKRQGLLYAGTERGVYVSFDRGEQWQSFQLNLPISPVTDLAVKNDDLVVATQGRSFWVLDDLTPLHQLGEDVVEAENWLYAPRASYRLDGRGRWPTSSNNGDNLPDGVLIHYLLGDEPDSNATSLRILEADGTEIRSFEATEKQPQDQMPLEPGMNRLVWNLRYPDAETFDGMILWAGNTRGPKAVPGEYRIELTVGDWSASVPLRILKDPRSASSIADLQEQFDFLSSIRDELSEVHGAIERIRDLRQQVKGLTSQLGERDGAEEIEEAGKALLAAAEEIEKALYQTQNESQQDPLNFPIRLNNKLAGVSSTASFGAYKPTAQALAVRQEISAKISVEMEKLAKLVEEQLPGFNELVRAKAIPAVLLKQSD